MSIFENLESNRFRRRLHGIHTDEECSHRSGHPAKGYQSQQPKNLGATSRDRGSCPHSAEQA